MEQTFKKIYSEKEIWVGTFLGGPLVAGYLIAENFKAFDQTDRVRKTWILAIITTFIVFGIAFSIPDSVKIPNQIIPIIYTFIAYQLVQLYQKGKINTHINEGGQIFSWWRTIGIATAGLLITIIPIFGYALLSDSTTTIGTDVKTYGIMNHEISYDQTNITDNEINSLADGFISTTFFDQSITKYVYVRKINQNYEISISCNNSVTSSAESLEPFIQLRNEMQRLFPNNKIIFNLIVENIDNVVKRLE